MTHLIPIPDPANMDSLPWYAKDHSLPEYRFVPGLYPHPIRDPKGHSYRTLPVQTHSFWAPDDWNMLEAYLRGVDLFNRFYFWESHEAWEPLWTTYPAEAEPARFIQGLINMAASFLKLHMHEATSTQKLWNAASAQLVRFSDTLWMGLDVNQLLEEAETFLLPIKNGTTPLLGSATPSIRLRRF